MRYNTLSAQIRNTCLDLFKSLYNTIKIYSRYKKQLKERRKYQQQVYHYLIDINALIHIATKHANIRNFDHLATLYTDTVDALKSALGITGISTTVYTITVAGIKIVKTFTLPQYAQYCVVNDNITDLGNVNISRSTYSSQPDRSIIQSSGFTIYHRKWTASGEGAYFKTNAMLSANGKTLWTYSYSNLNATDSEVPCALIIYF